LLAAGLGLATAARAGDDHFALGYDALAEGRFDDAIEQLEAHADRAAPHPDASFNRGLAYLLRVRNNAEKPGDLGRAAAAFEEALAMRPGDGDAEQALELVQGEVARRRARRGEDGVLARPTLDRVVMRLASERVWGILAVIASLLLSVGLVLRKRPAGPAHLAGVLLSPASAIGLLLFLPLYVGARELRLGTTPAVLVVGEAHLTDADGASLGGEPIPEAAKLEISERRGRLLRVRYGSVEGWLPAATVRVLRVR
jgi:tetratricopeptide (TPR) repeat protein